MSGLSHIASNLHFNLRYLAKTHMIRPPHRPQDGHAHLDVGRGDRNEAGFALVIERLRIETAIKVAQLLEATLPLLNRGTADEKSFAIYVRRHIADTYWIGQFGSLEPTQRGEPFPFKREFDRWAYTDTTDDDILPGHGRWQGQIHVVIKIALEVEEAFLGLRDTIEFRDILQAHRVLGLC